MSSDAFINGEHDNDIMNYYVLGIWGAAISLSLTTCARSTSIELKFLQILVDKNVHIWDVTPMRSNINQARQRRGMGSSMRLLKCILDKLWGDEMIKEYDTKTGRNC